MVQKHVKETTGKPFDWDYMVYVKDKERLKAKYSNGYVVPKEKIKVVKSLI